MTVDIRSIAVSTVFAWAAALALWPPRAVYWTAVAAVVGEAVALAAVAAVAIALGAAFATLAGVGVREFAVGAAVAYLVGMAVIAVALAPDSPVHLALYGGICVCLVAGVAGASVR